MPENQIPDEIMRKAERAWSAAFMKGGNPVGIIAGALMAERERAADICRRIEDQCGMEAGLATACADAILNPSEKNNG